MNIEAKIRDETEIKGKKEEKLIRLHCPQTVSRREHNLEKDAAVRFKKPCYLFPVNCRPREMMFQTDESCSCPAAVRDGYLK